MRSVTVWCESAVLSVFVAASVAAQAPALDVRLGLWEITSTSQVAGQTPEFDTSKMTPEQKAQMDKAMQGMLGTHNTVTKSCITKEKLEKSVFMMEDRPGTKCKQNVTSNTRSTLEATVTCTGEEAMTGQMHIDALSSTSVKGVIKFENAVRGRAMNVNIAMSGKWLGADCGSEK